MRRDVRGAADLTQVLRRADACAAWASARRQGEMTGVGLTRCQEGREGGLPATLETEAGMSSNSPPGRPRAGRVGQGGVNSRSRGEAAPLGWMEGRRRSLATPSSQLSWPEPGRRLSGHRDQCSVPLGTGWRKHLEELRGQQQAAQASPVARPNQPGVDISAAVFSGFVFKCFHWLPFSLYVGGPAPVASRQESPRVLSWPPSGRGDVGAGGQLHGFPSCAGLPCGGLVTRRCWRVQN